MGSSRGWKDAGMIALEPVELLSSLTNSLVRDLNMIWPIQTGRSTTWTSWSS